MEKNQPETSQEVLKIEDPRLEKLKTQYLGKELVSLLTAPTPTESVWTRPARGGMSVRYVPGTYFIQKLNECFGFLWDFEIVNERLDGNQIVVKGKLSIKIPGTERIVVHPDGTKEIIKTGVFEVSKTQFGGQEIKKYTKNVGQNKPGDVIDLADDFKGAATDAMKKCGTLFGIALDVYGSGSGGREAIREKVASSGQLDTIYSRGEKIGINKDAVDKLIMEDFNKEPEALNKEEVMEVIQNLIKRGKQG